MSHVEDSKRNLAKEVHRFACLVVRIESYPNGGMVVHHNSESSLVFDGKSKQHLDSLFIELKESILGKMNESFSQGRMVF